MTEVICAATDCENSVTQNDGRGGLKRYCSEVCRNRSSSSRLRARRRKEGMEAGSALMEADPVMRDRMTEIAREIGVDRRHFYKYVQRARMKTGVPALPEVLDNAYFVSEIERTMGQIVSSVDMVDIQESGLKDKVVAFRGLTEARQLLKGEPTAIHSYTKIKKLAEIGELLHAELERRPKVIEAEFEDVA